MADPVSLAASCAMPPVLSKSAVAPGEVKRSAHIKMDSYNVGAVAPYQAMPVAGPVITHHKSTALPVVEPHPEMTAEVRTAARAWVAT